MSYISAVLDKDDFAAVISQIGKFISPWMTVVAEPHVTLAHSKSHQEQYHALLAKLPEMSRGTIECTHIISTPRQVILRVNPATVESANTHPHITVALADGVQAFESNRVLHNIELGYSNWTGVSPFCMCLAAVPTHVNLTNNKRHSK